MNRWRPTNILSLLFGVALGATLCYAQPATSDDFFETNRDAIPILLQWLKGQDFGKPGSRALRDQLRARMLSDEGGRAEDLRSLALKGFDLLGTNGAPALPELRVIAYSPLSDSAETALDAMISIGTPAWPTATNLAKHSNSYLRRKGAYLLGALRTEPEQSVPLLLKLIDDPNPTVSSAAFTALGEFPAQEIRSIIREKLLDPSSAFYAAYSMHSSGTEAMRVLIDTCEGTKDRQIRIAALGALAFQERTQKAEDLTGPRRSAYPRKWCDYGMQVNGIGFLFYRDLDQEAFITAVKSNIVHHHEPKIRQTSSNLVVRMSFSGFPLNQFSPGQIAGRYWHSYFIAGGDSISISTNGTFRFSRSGCMVDAISEVQGRVEHDGDILRFIEERRSIPNMGMKIEEGLESYSHVYPVFWDERTYLIPTNSMARFCAAVNAGYEPRNWGLGEYLAKVENWKVAPKGMPELPDAWKGYVFANQIQGNVWQAVNTREAWINLGKGQGVLPGMILFCYDPLKRERYARVPEIRVVEVLQERSRVTSANADLGGLHEGLIVASGALH